MTKMSLFNTPAAQIFFSVIQSCSVTEPSKGFHLVISS